MAKETLFKYFETEEKLIDVMVNRGAKRNDLEKSLSHEREHEQIARQLGYNNIKWQK